jgi:ABC-type antimicrobial peptide transport system permease subunit
MAYATVRRFNEFGLRMALGAGRGIVGRMVVGEALRLVGLGALLGIPAAIAATSLLRSRWYGIGAIDLPSLAIALGVMVVSAVIAAYLPALRASRVPPLIAIQSE